MRDSVARAKTRIWGLNTLEYHDGVNTLTFASYRGFSSRLKLEAPLGAMPDKIRGKMLDLMENGARSAHVPGAGGCSVCAEMEARLRAVADGCRLRLADALHRLFLPHRLHRPGWL